MKIITLHPVWHSQEWVAIRLLDKNVKKGKCIVKQHEMKISHQSVINIGIITREKG